MDDLISRQAAIDALGDEPEVWSEKDEYDQGLNNQWHYDVNALKAVPSAERHGRWVSFEFGDERWHKCSVCGTADEYINHLGLVAIRNYCPNCGAKMDEVSE